MFHGRAYFGRQYFGGHQMDKPVRDELHRILRTREAMTPTEGWTNGSEPLSERGSIGQASPAATGSHLRAHLLRVDLPRRAEHVQWDSENQVVQPIARGVRSVSRLYTILGTAQQLIPVGRNCWVVLRLLESARSGLMGKTLCWNSALATR